MFGLTRWSPFEDLFNFQREVDRLFNQFWSDLPARAGDTTPGSFQVKSDENGWRVEVPMPGIDPQHVNLEAAGNSVSIRAEVPGQGEPRPRADPRAAAAETPAGGRDHHRGQQRDREPHARGAGAAAGMTRSRVAAGRADAAASRQRWENRVRDSISAPGRRAAPVRGTGGLAAAGHPAEPP